ncbi:DUF2917 domain-containing protein [Variovorax sp. LjRoot84]
MSIALDAWFFFDRTMHRPSRASGRVASAQPPTTRALARHATWTIDDPRPFRVECLVGIVWITQDGDPRDVILVAGETYRPDRVARMLVHALDEAQVRLARG